MAKRGAKVGDIFEIPLSNEKMAFGHYVFKDKRKGPLVQIYDLILSESENVDLETLTKLPLRFPPVITGVVAATRTGMWRVIGNVQVEDFEYPKFVSTFWDEKTGKARIWFLWDGMQETKLGWTLPDKYKKLEYLVAWSPYDIVDRIETGEIGFPYRDLILHNKFEPKT